MPRATKANQLVLDFKKVLEDFKIAQGSRSLAIAAKKEKFLNERTTIRRLKKASQPEREELIKNLIGGINVTTGNAEFLTQKKVFAKKRITFMKKREDGIGATFGNMLYRVLSAKTYAGKRVNSYENSDSAVIKWDKNLSTFHSSRPGEIFESSIDPTGNQKDFEFVKSYARAVAVEGVLGETDYNPKNILRSAKTNRVVFIDRTALGNHNHGYYKHHSYGSAACSDFLRIFLGQKNENLAWVDANAARDKVKSKYNSLVQGYSKMLDWALGRIEEARRNNNRNRYERYVKIYNYYLRQEAHAKDRCSKDLHQVTIDSYSRRIDENLFQDIIKNIEKPENEHLKAFFMEFMSGIEDSINLAGDKDFLKSYIEKVIRETGVKSKKKLEILESKFLANAEFAKKQYKTLLDHYRKIKAQINLKSSPNEGPEETAKDEQEKKKEDLLALKQKLAEKAEILDAQIKDSTFSYNDVVINLDYHLGKRIEKLKKDQLIGKRIEKLKKDQLNGVKTNGDELSKIQSFKHDFVNLANIERENINAMTFEYEELVNRIKDVENEYDKLEKESLPSQNLAQQLQLENARGQQKENQPPMGDKPDLSKNRKTPPKGKKGSLRQNHGAALPVASKETPSGIVSNSEGATFSKPNITTVTNV